jgi:hypothetical protein
VQLLAKTIAIGLISLQMAVNSFMAITHIIRNLIWTPLFLKAGHRFIPVFVIDSDRITGG